MTDRTPPHSVEAEKEVLGSVLVRASAWDEIADLATDDFLIPINREIFEAMRALSDRRCAIDVVTLSEEMKSRGSYGRLKDGESHLSGLAVGAGNSERVAHYAKIVTTKAILRRAIAACAETAAEAFGNVEDVEEFLAATRARFGSLEMRGAGSFVRLGDELDAVIDTIEKRHEEPDHYIVRTGLAKLDDALGGLRGSQLIVVGGNPGHGKTALAWDFLLNAAGAGIPCALVSMEMKRSEMIERALSKRARVDGRRIAGGRLDLDDWRRVQDPAVKDGLRLAPVWINDRRMTAKRVCSEVRRWAAKQHVHLGVVAIDYLGLVRNEKEGVNRSRELGEMTEAFKALAKELDVPVVLCAQLNRANTGGADGKPRAPRVSDLRDSGEIEQAADVVLFPWWEGEPGVGIPHPASIIIGKQRNGPQGSVPCQWEREFTTFSDRSVDAYYQQDGGDE